MDWTDREAWARCYVGKKGEPPRVRSADPDADKGRRRESGNGFSFQPRRKKASSAPGTTKAGGLDVDGWEADKNQGFFGYIPHVAVAAPQLDGPPVPEIALALRVDSASDMNGVGRALTSMVDSICEVAPIDHVIVDRGYTMRSPESVHLPLANRGIHMTFDLAHYQRARSGEVVHGAIAMGGDFYCPLIPQDIVVESIPGPQADRDDWAEYHRRYEQREQWMMKQKGAPTADMNSQRLGCPAANPNPTVRCPKWPESLEVDVDADIPEIHEEQFEHVRRANLTCCNQKSFTVKQHHGAGTRQQYHFGSKKWIESYERRTASERYISHYKHLVRTRREDIRMFGQVRQTLALAFATVAVNILLLRGWEGPATH